MSDERRGVDDDVRDSPCEDHLRLAGVLLVAVRTPSELVTQTWKQAMGPR
jgi:hypothetical protein